MKDKDYKNRKKSNQELLRIFSEYLEMYPDIRFSQALRNLIKEIDINAANSEAPKYEFPNFIWQNEFNLESEDLLKRVQEEIGER